MKEAVHNVDPDEIGKFEKLASRSTGPIIACPITRQLADGEFAFRDLGTHRAKGFDDELDLYALVREK